MNHPTDEFYRQLAIEATKVMAPMVVGKEMTPQAWGEFVGDIFDLTDAICSELDTRLERNRKFREKDPEWLKTNAVPASTG